VRLFFPRAGLREERSYTRLCVESLATACVDKGASLGRSKFDGVDLSFAIFDHADVHGSTFYDTKLEVWPCY